jgi:hypothetical protein
VTESISLHYTLQLALSQVSTPVRARNSVPFLFGVELSFHGHAAIRNRDTSCSTCSQCRQSLAGPTKGKM